MTDHRFSLADRPYSQLSRLLIVAEAVAARRYGITTEDVWRATCDAYGFVCRRTVYRDLQFLESTGMVDRTRRPEGGRRQWQWVSESVRGAVLLRMKSVAG